jgi:hypothetical protein
LRKITPQALYTWDKEGEAKGPEALDEFYQIAAS